MAIYHMYIGDTGPFIVNDDRNLPLSDEKQRGVTILDEDGDVVARLHVDQGNLVVRDDQDTPNEQTIALQKSTQKEVVLFQIAGTTEASFTTMQTPVPADTSDPDPENHIPAHTVTTVQLNLPSSLDVAATSGITEVVSDGTLTGKGTSAMPLKVAVPYSNVEKNKLAEQLDKWLFGTSKTYTVGDLVLYSKKVYECLTTHSASGTSVSDSPDMDSAKWRALSGEVGEDNVQADWDEDDDTADAYIKNKPSGLFGSFGQPVSIAAVTSTDLQANEALDLEVASVGEGGFVKKGTGGDSTKIVFLNAGVYHLYGTITKMADDRTGPSFNVVGTGVTVDFWSNAYSRDADTAHAVRRMIEFEVANADTAVTLQVINREVFTSSSKNNQTQPFTVSAVSGIKVRPAISVEGKPGPQGPPGDLTQVSSDATLSGLGTQASPLKVAIPFTASEKTTALAGEANVNPNWDEDDPNEDSHILNKPTLAPSDAEANVKPDWDAAKGNAAEILNKPTIPPAVVAADAISPAADDQTGAVGTEGQYAREDHKHPKQKVIINEVEVGVKAKTKLPQLTDALTPSGGAGVSETFTQFMRVKAVTDNDTPALATDWVRDFGVMPYEYGNKTPVPADTISTIDAYAAGHTINDFDSYEFHLEIDTNGNSSPYQDFMLTKRLPRFQPYATSSDTAQRLFTVENDAIYSINTVTGATTKILSLSESVYHVPGFASDLSQFSSATYGGGFIWAKFPYRAGTTGTPLSYLYKINPANGNVERVAPISIQGLDLNYTNGISMLYQGSSLYLTTSTRLYTVNTSTGALTRVGAGSHDRAMAGLAYDGTNAYGVGGTVLFSINLSTGAGTVRGPIRVDSISGRMLRAWSLEFFGGTLYAIEQDGISSKLYSINITSGTSINIATLVGTLTNVGGNIGTLGSGNITLLANSENDKRNLISFDPGNPDRKFAVWSDPDDNSRFYCFSTVELARVEVIARAHAKYNRRVPVING